MSGASPPHYPRVLPVNTRTRTKAPEMTNPRRASNLSRLSRERQGATEKGRVRYGTGVIPNNPCARVWRGLRMTGRGAAKDGPGIEPERTASRATLALR